MKRANQLSRCHVVTGLVLMAFLATMAAGQTAVFAKAIEGPKSFAALAKEVMHPVVNISTTQVMKGAPMGPFPGRGPGAEEFFRHFFGEIPPMQRETHALGSGLIIDKEGHILTNNHVVASAKEIKVKLEFGKEYDAKVVGRDPQTDLALIKVDPGPDFPEPAVLGDSDAIQIGDWVMAVGNPFGLGHTVTQGILSARGRVIGAGPYDDFLQTDAAINPGNSGGPLFDEKGEVIGINTAIVAAGQGIGFAIPINMAKALMPQLKTGRVVRGWLGVVIQNITPEIAKFFHLKEAKGVLISDVAKGSPADEAGLRRGDVITRFDGKDVESAAMLARLVATIPPDTEVKVEILRNEKPETVTVKIGTKPEAGEERPEVQKEAFLGMTVQKITPELAERFGWEKNEQGVVVSQIQPGSPAAEAGLQPGDLIKEMNRRPINNLSEYNEAVAKVKPKENVLFLVKRSQQTFFVVVKPAE